MSKFRALARLFRRTDNEVITQLYTHAINRPLFVEPGLGEQLLGAYMAGAVDYESNRAPRRAEKIAILDVSGALASRPMPGPSGDGPQNYEELRSMFDRVMDDPSVDAVVFRMDSPGGFAAGLFDLTDHIFSRRDEKPVHAVIDDMALSAAYGIASAASQIWVSRTASVGSVGVVAYHVDQSEADAKEGMKITPIYAGARKIDFSPHFALSDEAKRREQEIVDRLYDMFTSAVHRYRGLSVEAVEGTEANVFFGDEALEVGFADRIGTLHDALAFLAGGETHREETIMSDQIELADAAPLTPEATSDPAAVVAAVLSADIPSNLQVALLKAGLKEEDVEARVQHAKAVHSLCATAKFAGLAETFVLANTPVDTVRDALLANKADSEASVDVTLKNVPASDKAGLSVNDVYRSRQAQVDKLRG